jgi:hypothetical protein
MNGTVVEPSKIGRQVNEQYKPSPRGILEKFKAVVENHRNKKLIKAVQNYDYKEVECLIRKGADPNAVDEEEMTVLENAKEALLHIPKTICTAGTPLGNLRELEHLRSEQPDDRRIPNPRYESLEKAIAFLKEHGAK